MNDYMDSWAALMYYNPPPHLKDMDTDTYYSVRDWLDKMFKVVAKQASADAYDEALRALLGDRR